MVKQMLFLAVVISTILLRTTQGAQIDSNWVGGSEGNWDNASNWDPPIVPDNNASNIFNVTIDSDSIGVNEVGISLNQDRTINRLDCYGKVKVAFWGLGIDRTSLTFNEPSSLTNHGYLKMWGDYFEIDGDVNNIPGSTLALQGARVLGTLFNDTNATMTLDEIGEYISIDGIHNLGSMVVIPDGLIISQQFFYNDGNLQLFSASSGCDNGTFENTSDGVVEGSGWLYASQLLDNKGTIFATSDSLVLYVGNTLNNSGILRNAAGAIINIILMGSTDPNNDGMIEVNVGGAVTLNRNLTNNPSAIIQLKGGNLSATTITQTADANFVGFGGIAGDVVIDPNAIIKLSGPTNIFGDVNIATNATLEISDGTTLVTGYTTNNGTIHMKGGRIIPQGGITNNGNVIWEPGTYNNIADFNLDGQVNFKDFTYFADTWLWQSAL